MLVKAVPGSRADAIAGLLGDRIKIRVAAPPEDGRANEAICRLVAARLGLAPRSVRVMLGVSSREKVLRIDGLNAAEARRRIGIRT